MADQTPITIATSFGATRLDAQQRALASWRRLGFGVVALNAASEIEALRPHFADVEFVPATRDAASMLGRPYVFIRDLAAIAAARSSVCAIVNSDVELDTSALSTTLTAEEARRSLVELSTGALMFGNRTDYRAGARDAGETYALGYDYFFFDRSLAARLPDEPFCLGVPWWDYWLPDVCHALDMPLRHVASPIAFHELHDTAYSHQLWMMYAGLMNDRLERIDAAPMLTPQSRNASRDISKRTIRLAEQFRESIERRAVRVTIGESPR